MPRTQTLTVWLPAPTRLKSVDTVTGEEPPVLLGGSHVTLVPQDARPHADAIAVGEADLLFPRMVRDFQRRQLEPDRKSTRLNSSHIPLSRMPSSA